MKFRCGWCLKEKDEEEPKKFRFAWTSPLRPKPGREFYLCEKCREKFKPVKRSEMCDTNSIKPAPIPSDLIFFRDFRKKGQKGGK